MQSILKQSFSNFEIIAVDDGSTDDTGQLLEQFHKKDQRIKVIRQDNSGLGAARNKGFEFASGKYTLFIDSDDFIEDGLLENVVHTAEDTDADIVLFGARTYNNITKVYGQLKFLPDKRVFGNSKVINRKNCPDKIMQIANVPVWNKLYRTEFLRNENLSFQTLHNNEDVMFVLSSFCLATRIAYLDQIFYDYRRGLPNSLTSKKTLHPLCFITAIESLFDKLHEKGVFCEVEKSFVNIAVSLCFYQINSMQEKEVQKLIKEELRQEHWKRMKVTEYPDSYYDEFGKRNFIRSFIMEA